MAGAHLLLVVNMKLELENARLREASGSITINSKLVSFLYQLMRDHVPAGEIESLMMNSSEPDVLYTNGWLAKYAEYIANRLL